jgi:hypothetical protein
MNLKPFWDILSPRLPEQQVFMYHLPDSFMEGVLILHGAVGAKLDPDLPDYKRAKFQVIVRSDNYESGYGIAKQVMAVFKAVNRYSDGIMLIHFIQPLNDPISYPVSKGGFTEFSVNFETVYVEH